MLSLTRMTGLTTITGFHTKSFHFLCDYARGIVITCIYNDAAPLRPPKNKARTVPILLLTFSRPCRKVFHREFCFSKFEMYFRRILKFSVFSFTGF